MLLIVLKSQKFIHNYCFHKFSLAKILKFQQKVKNSVLKVKFPIKNVKTHFQNAWNSFPKVQNSFPKGWNSFPQDFTRVDLSGIRAKKKPVKILAKNHSWPYAYYILALFLLHKGRVHLLCALLSVEFGRGRLVPINIFNKNSHNLSYTLFTTKNLKHLDYWLIFISRHLWGESVSLDLNVLRADCTDRDIWYTDRFRISCRWLYEAQKWSPGIDRVFSSII